MTYYYYYHVISSQSLSQEKYKRQFNKFNFDLIYNQGPYSSASYSGKHDLGHV